MLTSRLMESQEGWYNSLSTKSPTISVSIVSHSQTDLLKALLVDLQRYCNPAIIEVLLTLNLPETLPFGLTDFGFTVVVLENSLPKGFAANHNQAFTKSTGQFFCVLNPDVRLTDDPFPSLLRCLQGVTVGLAAPLVVDEQGRLEDSARHFPTPFKILCKAIGRCRGNDYVVKNAPVYPDWVGGMFMLFPEAVFKQLDGFDQRYFLYYEDVDLCARLKLHGYEVMLCPDARVIHEARRDSHRRLRYLKWHLASMMRFFFSAIFVRICWRKLTGRAK